MIEIVNRICSQLPSGWIITLEMEKDSAWIDLEGPLGEYSSWQDLTDKTIVEQLEDALCMAKGWGKA